MAVAPVPPLVPVDEYLNCGYHPDVEYVDGALVERGRPTFVHGLLQKILLAVLEAYEDALGFVAVPGVRTQIIERARDRIPDVMLCPTPTAIGKVMTSVPWGVIEVLSPDDRAADLLERCRDYKRIGALHVITLDPEALIAYQFENGSLIETQCTSLDLPTGSLPFDTADLFQKLVEKRNKVEGKS